MTGNSDGTDLVDICIRDVQNELRVRFKNASNEEGMTYEELLQKFLDYRDDNTEEFLRYDPEERDRGGRTYRQKSQ